MPDVVISYKNTTIDSLSAPGIKTINSSGKYLEDDIIVSYTKPTSSWAGISVAYPSGSTCTATNGTITLTASNTSGSYLFEVPEPSSKPETWTVSCTNGTSSDSETVSISTEWQIAEVELEYGPVISSVLNDNSWDVISYVAKAGLGDTYWDLGDAKQITFKSGSTVGVLSLSNVSLCVFILSFNHVENGVTDNNILFSGFKSAVTNGVVVALNDSQSSNRYGQLIFNLNHWGASSGTYSTNYGGWKGCDLRYDILGGTSTPPSGYGATATTSRVGYDATESTITNPVANTLMAAIPDDFRAVLRLRTHYIDNKGNKSNALNNVTVVVDAISLLSEYELYGTQSKANQYEANTQNIMGYYVAGNLRTRYRYNNTGSSTAFWLASPAKSSSSAFCYAPSAADSYGYSSTINSQYAYSIAPVFKV